jgi:hypothetical protein
MRRISMQRCCCCPMLAVAYDDERMLRIAAIGPNSTTAG